MPDKRDKTTGLPLPNPVDPGSTICVTLQIPDAPEYRQAFRGFVADLGKWWTWQHTAGQDDAPAREAAELWRVAANSITYSEDCEGTMSCYDVANCIEVNPATRDAINNLLSNGPGQTNVYNTSYYGAPMLAAQRNTPIATDPSGVCSPDVLFGSITAIVDQLNTNNVDFLEIILLTDNQQQRVSKVIKAIPLLNQVPIDEALDFVSQMTTEIKENYEAQYTSSLRDTYRCDLFCIAQEAPGCEITFQMLVEYYNNRIGTALEPINFFGALVQYFVSGSWAGSTVVDIMTLIQLAVWQEASNWLGVSLRTLQTVGLLGSNDPDHDWAVIPCDCAPPEITLTKVGYAGQVFGVVPPFADSGEPFDVLATIAPASANDRVVAFVFSVDCELTVNSTTWTFCPTGDPSAALWGYCPIGVPDSTNLGYWVFVREGSGATTLQIPDGLECRGIWIEGACGVQFTTNITLEVITSP